MIDVESQIYTPIAVALRETFPGIDVSGEYVKAPSAFPHVSIVEQDNYPTLEHLSTSDKEQFATLMYEVNVYTNTVGYKKSEAKDIMEAVDGEFSKLGFARTMCNPISNLSDATIYRMVARYTATVGKDFWVYRAD